MYKAQTQITMASENCEYLCEFAKSFQIPLFVQEKGGQLVPIYWNKIEARWNFDEKVNCLEKWSELMQV